VAPFLPNLPQTDSSLWYNSWTLPAGSYGLIIVYLPQYLQFLGYFLLLLTPIVILLIRKPKKTLHQKGRG
jgi:hypothetical protein